MKLDIPLCEDIDEIPMLNRVERGCPVCGEMMETLSIGAKSWGDEPDRELSRIRIFLVCLGCGRDETYRLGFRSLKPGSPVAASLVQTWTKAKMEYESDPVG